MMKKMYPNHQYVIETHIDREHIHNHILVNSVDFEVYKKINSNKKSLEKLRKISDDICKEKGLSVISYSEFSHRKELMTAIDDALNKSSSFEEFISHMQEQNYQIKQGKNYSFKGENDKNFIRLSSLGTAYSESAITKRIEEKVSILNRKKQVYDNKSIKMSKRKRLRITIESAIKNSNSFDEFLKKMESEGYEIKRGKHLAFRYSSDERFQRLSSLGELYEEDMLKIRIENYDTYLQILAEIKERTIEKTVSNSDVRLGKKQLEKNINANIKTVVFLKNNGIHSIEDLNKKINELQEKRNSQLKEVSAIKGEISAKYDIVNSLRIYWQYKPLAYELRKIKVEKEQEKFLEQHTEEIGKFKNAIEIINNAKDKNGNIPKADQLYNEVEKLNEIKEKILSENKKVKEELQLFENAKHNFYAAMNFEVQDKTTHIYHDQNSR